MATSRSPKRESFEHFEASFDSGERSLWAATFIGRSGSLLVHALLDGHPEIFAMPGAPLSYYTGMWRHLSSGQAPWPALAHQWLSSLEEGWAPQNVYAGLGEDGSRSWDVPFEGIARGAATLLRHRPQVDRRSVLLALHYAAAVLTGRDLGQVRVLYLHEHEELGQPRHAQSVADLLRDFPLLRVLCSVRDPRSNLLSILRWDARRDAHCDRLVEQRGLRVYRDTLQVAELLHDRWDFLRLEDLQADTEATTRALAARMGVRWSPTMCAPTFGGHPWPGDNFGTRGTQVQRGAAQQRWRRELDPMRRAALEEWLADEIRALGYPPRSTGPVSERLLDAARPVWAIDQLRRNLRPGYYRARGASRRRERVRALVADLKRYPVALQGLSEFAEESAPSYAHTPSCILRPAA